MISVDNLGVSFNGNFLFRNVSFQLKGGDKVGLVGKNGAGKSTLLKVLSTTIPYDEGNLVIPKEFKVGYLRQDLTEQGDNSVREEAAKAFADATDLEATYERLTKEVSERTDYESDSYSDLVQQLADLGAKLEISDVGKQEGEIEKILLGLGFKTEELDNNIREFSGGWRMRVELAKILLQKPEALFLDEPTNHLDIVSIQWLENYLKKYGGILVLISHDQDFLDAITKRTIEISNQRIYDFKTNYSKYLEQREVLFEQQYAAKVNQDKKIEEMERFISRFRAQATKASAVQSKIKQLEKIERIELDQRKVDQMKMRFPEPPRAGKVVVEVANVSKSFGPKDILKDISLLVGRSDKIAFVGRNGEGKSTLSKIIVGELQAEGKIELGHNVKLGYYAQNQAEELDLNKTVFETIDDIAVGDIRKYVRDLLGSFLFSGEDIEKKVGVLSGGEKARLALCKLLLEPYNFLVLDEPTNHLDIPSKEILKDALLNYQGAMLVVSHDREFLRALTGKIYEFKDQKVKEFIGDIDYYLKQNNFDSMDDLQIASAKKKVEVKPDSNQKKQLDQQIKKLSTKLSKAEQDVEFLETKKSQVEQELHLPENSTNTQLFADFQKIEEQLLEAMEAWESLSAEMDTLDAQRKSLYN